MTITAGAIVLAAAVSVVACAKKAPPPMAAPPAPAPEPKAPPRDLIVLLPDDDGTVGKAIVSTSAGSIELAQAGASTRVASTELPSAATMSDEEVQATFQDVITSMPRAPERFLLYFRFESDELTADSRKTLPAIFAAVQGRPAPEVVAIGHTDSTGPASQNAALGLRRARAVGKLLIGTKVDASYIETTSHGESDPLIATADEVSEPRNRRVEITVR